MSMTYEYPAKPVIPWTFFFRTQSITAGLAPAARASR